jgi:hypothetical protein
MDSERVIDAQTVVLDGDRRTRIGPEAEAHAVRLPDADHSVLRVAPVSAD